jgi:hypothetical protein
MAYSIFKFTVQKITDSERQCWSGLCRQRRLSFALSSPLEHPDEEGDRPAQGEKQHNDAEGRHGAGTVARILVRGSRGCSRLKICRLFSEKVLKVISEQLMLNSLNILALDH